jgi:hypothetical protein
MTQVTKNIELKLFSLDSLTKAIDEATQNIPPNDTRIWALEGIVKTAVDQAIASGYLRAVPQPTVTLNQTTECVTMTAYTTGKTPHFISLEVR